MAKLSKDELIAKINEKVMDEDVSIELIEDISDSMEVTEDTSTEDKERIEELEGKLKEIRTKYKERFLKGKEKKEDEEDEEDEGLEEKEVIDIKEI